MLFKQHVLDAIAAGDVTLAFRTWRRPSVKSGGRLRTAIGELTILDVQVVRPSSISDRDAARAGFTSREELLAALDGGRKGTPYRIEFQLRGPDARVALRENAKISATEYAAINEKLDRYDAASTAGAWTRRVLRLIAKHPEMKAGDLADRSGLAKEWLKIQIRKLKELGLTESLSPGYRISPRGRAFLARTKS